MNEIAMTQTELTVEDTMIHALQELKKTERRTIRLISQYRLFEE